MGLYNRFAKELSESLFNSVYTEMYKIAESEQKAIYQNNKRKNYHVGEAQENFSAFCKGKLSLGDALDFIKVRKAYGY